MTAASPLAKTGDGLLDLSSRGSLKTKDRCGSTPVTESYEPNYPFGSVHKQATMLLALT